MRADLNECITLINGELELDDRVCEYYNFWNAKTQKSDYVRLQSLLDFVNKEILKDHTGWDNIDITELERRKKSALEAIEFCLEMSRAPGPDTIYVYNLVYNYA